MEIKLFDSELKVMNIIWAIGDTTAKRIAEIAAEQIGWNKTTTYTIIRKCLTKGAIERHDPNFVCHALITKEQIQMVETNALIDKVYDGAADRLVASILGSKSLTLQEIERLKQLVRELE